jgi:tRNA threonylcarbamoyl adenosine modification protein (Sua5/YciO/YrdC/YwlC family)
MQLDCPFHSSFIIQNCGSMAQFFTVHPDNPQPRLMRRAAEILRAGGVIVYPTDSCYALGCHPGDKSAVERIRAIRQVDRRHHFALVCRDLAEVGQYASMDNRQFRLVKAAMHGGYTFILRATREVPKRLQHPSRKTIGVRIPDHRVAQALLSELQEPVLSSTLLLPGAEHPLNDAQDIRAALEHAVDLVLDCGSCGIVPTTVVDLTGEAPRVIRAGKGSLAVLGL